MPPLFRNSRTIASDHAVGVENEEAVLPRLASLVGVPLTRDTNPMAAMDLHDDARRRFAETKRRFCNHDTHPDIIIGYNKIQFCDSPGREGWFCWVFDDGAYYIKYDPNVFCEFETSVFRRTDRATGVDRPSVVVRVPVSRLVPLPA